MARIVRGSEALRGLANPIALCDGYGVFFVGACGRIRMAASRNAPALSLYWNTLEDALARALYDKVGRHSKGLIHYAHRRDAAG
jgi:hypothetical protein